MERILFYEEAARNFAKNWGRNVSDHVINIIASVMMARDGVRPGGHFVQAVIDNDLYAALSRADDEVLTELKLITQAKREAYIENLISFPDYETPK
jgi:predicted RecB family endonuclease